MIKKEHATGVQFMSIDHITAYSNIILRTNYYIFICSLCDGTMEILCSACSDWILILIYKSLNNIECILRFLKWRDPWFGVNYSAIYYSSFISLEYCRTTAVIYLMMRLLCRNTILSTVSGYKFVLYSWIANPATEKSFSGSWMPRYCSVNIPPSAQCWGIFSHALSPDSGMKILIHPTVLLFEKKKPI